VRSGITGALAELMCGKALHQAIGNAGIKAAVLAFKQVNAPASSRCVFQFAAARVCQALDFFTLVFFTAGFLTTAFLAGTFLTAAFFAGAFFATNFFAGALAAATFLTGAVF